MRPWASPPLRKGSARARGEAWLPWKGSPGGRRALVLLPAFVRTHPRAPGCGGSGLRQPLSQECPSPNLSY